LNGDVSGHVNFIFLPVVLKSVAGIGFFLGIDDDRTIGVDLTYTIRR